MKENRMAILAAAPAYGHLIPAIRLGMALRANGCETQFVSYDDVTAELCGRFGFNTLRLMKSVELEDEIRQLIGILGEQKPRISVSDWSAQLWWAIRAERPACRISVLRCEGFKGYRRRNPFSFDKFFFEDRPFLDWSNAFAATLGVAPMKDVHDLYDAEIIVVPGVPALDPLPSGVSESYPDTKIIYTGPLLLNLGDPLPERVCDWLASWRDKRVPIVLVTLGTAWGTEIYSAFADCFENMEFPVIMIVPAERERAILARRNGPRFQVVGLTNVRELAEQVDVVIHHGGHATIQTVLLAGKPSIVLPSGEYDREDNACRLEDLLCGKFLGHDFFRDGIRAEKIERTILEVWNDPNVQRGVSAMSGVVRNYVDRDGVAEAVTLALELS